MTILTGTLDAREGPPVHFGTLLGDWSSYEVGRSGWFYGPSSRSNTSVFDLGPHRPAWSVHDASAFDYNGGVLHAREGDTVLFAGADGSFGAWRLDDFEPSATPGEWGLPATLHVTWWWSSDGDFTTAGHQVDATAAGSFAQPIPEPSTALLVVLGLMVLGLGFSVRRR